ncbi:MAG: tetratricopeptide repeat protein [Bacteroidales bacterium]|nr:tetratricopeptide repeat protein [Bacteroidales bacterium]
MKKIFVSIIALCICAGAFAQDMAQATEQAQQAQEAFGNGDYEAALAGFREALAGAEAAGEEGLQLAETCKKAIPQILMSLGKKKLSESDFDGAVAALGEATKAAGEYGLDEFTEKADALVPIFLMQKGNALLNVKNFDGAVEAYKELIGRDPENGAAHLRLGTAFAGKGDVSAAEEAFKKAISCGEGEKASKQCANMFLKQAAARLKAKDFQGAADNAVKSNDYLATPQACQIAGQGFQLLKNNTEAAKYFVKYLELAPNAKNAGQIAYTLGALFQQAGDKAKAKEYYQKASSDPTYGAEAAKLAASL